MFGAAFVIALDQITKAAIVGKFLIHESYAVINGFFNLVYVLAEYLCCERTRRKSIPFNFNYRFIFLFLSQAFGRRRFNLRKSPIYYLMQGAPDSEGESQS